MRFVGIGIPQSQQKSMADPHRQCAQTLGNRAAALRLGRRYPMSDRRVDMTPPSGESTPLATAPTFATSK